MQLQLTAIYRKVRDGDVAFVEEMPGANTQGATLDEGRANLREAVELVQQSLRVLQRVEAESAYDSATS
jgi:predicted RNase H-like HicB family nuclease